MEKIESRHRLMAAAKIKIENSKGEEVRRKIISGLSDEHPLVQAAAFYDRKQKEK